MGLGLGLRVGAAVLRQRRRGRGAQRDLAVLESGGARRGLEGRGVDGEVCAREDELAHLRCGEM